MADSESPLDLLKPQSLIKSKLLVGEGIEELRFFESLLKHVNIGDVQIEQSGGKTRLHDYIATLPKRPGFSDLVTIAITRDADDDANAAFQSVRAALEKAHLAAPNASGTFSAGPPRVGVFILPDCEHNGMLEDLCLASVTADLATPCVEEFMRCVELKGRQPGNLAKARVHAWLSSQIVPDKRLGEAALAGLWDWNNTAFEPLKHFVRQL